VRIALKGIRAKGETELVLKVTADSKQVASGLKASTDALAGLKKSADAADAALDKIDGESVKVSLNDEAIANARKKIDALRAQVREGIELGTDTTAAQREISKLQRGIRSLTDKTVQVKVEAPGLNEVNRGMSNLDNRTGRLSGTMTLLKTSGPAALTAVGAGLAAVSVGSFKLAADMETLRVSMQGVVRDGGNVNKILDEISEFGALTPFTFPELAQTTKLLLGFGVASNDVVATVKNLAEASAGTGVELERIAVIYGQMLSKGIIMNEDLLQLQEAGVNAYEALALVIGKSEKETRELVAAGKLGREEIKKLDEALQQMFAGSVARQADTTNGKLSTLGDNVKGLGVALGEVLTMNAGPQIDQLIEFTGWLGKGKDDLVKFNDEWNNLFPGPHNKFDDAAEAEKKAADEAARLAEETRRANAATHKLAEEQRALAHEKGMEGLAADAKEANKAVEDLKDTFEALNGIFADSESFAIDWAQAWADVNEVVEKGEQGWKLNTEAGRNNREMMISQAQALDAEIKRRIEQHDRLDTIEADYASMRAELIKQAVALGATEEEAQDLVDTLLKVPKDLGVAVKLQNHAEFLVELNELLIERELFITPSLTDDAVAKLEAQIGQAFRDAGGFAQPGTPLYRSPVGRTATNPGQQSTPQVVIQVRERSLADFIDVSIRDSATGAIGGRRVMTL
jgi:tape measure domain-containing protein